jgi:5-methyltetrahydropteroyltriglutamate--homocysteine methyltransferase
MTQHLLPTTVVGSYPQPDWLIDRAMLATMVPRVRLQELWRIPEPFLAQAQDDATLLAIRDMERAGIDIITDGEMRRESYSNRFATALEGIDNETPATITNRAGRSVKVPRVVGKIRRKHAVEVSDMTFLRRNTERKAKITLPGPFTMAQQAKNEFYDDDDEMVMDLAAAVNAEAHDLVAAGADVIQLDEPWVRNDPEAAKRIAVKAIDRALRGLSVPTIVHVCFGYAAVVHSDKPSGYSCRPCRQDRRARRHRPRRPEGRIARAGGATDPRRAAIRSRRAPRSGARLRDEVPHARDRVRQAAGLERGGGAGPPRIDLGEGRRGYFAQATGPVSGFVLERERHPRAKGGDLAVLHLHVHLRHFRHAQVAQGAGRRFDRAPACVLPRFLADADDLDDLVDGFHLLLLRHCILPSVPIPKFANPRGAL